MDKIITKIAQPVSAPFERMRVAAYARVSSGKDAMLDSLAAQISYYSKLIQQRPEWQYAGVYTDEALTGTKDNRPEFQRMLTDCRDGQIDMVITKSISRFARNTVTLLETVRELKSLGIDVYFEEQNIHSMSGDGELMLTILASYAQEESRSVSENCKWRIRNNFKQGLPHGFSILGYKLNGDMLEIVPKEAELVKMIFNDYLGGMGKNAIMKKLNAAGIKTKRGNLWLESTVDRILRNEKFVGDMLLQKAYIVDHLDKKKAINHGVLPQYFVQDSHSQIIDRDTFEQVQEKLRSGAAKYNPGTTPAVYPFSGKIICERCGKNYRRKITGAGSKYAKPVWICPTFNSHGKSACPAKQIPEEILFSLTAEVLGLAEFDETVFRSQINRMRVPEANKVTFIFQEGNVVEAVWEDRSRKSSWSEEAKQKARERALALQRGDSK